jgi:hypothetical protein
MAVTLRRFPIGGIILRVRIRWRDQWSALVVCRVPRGGLRDNDDGNE